MADSNFQLRQLKIILSKSGQISHFNWQHKSTGADITKYDIHSQEWKRLNWTSLDRNVKELTNLNISGGFITKYIHSQEWKRIWTDMIVEYLPWNIGTHFSMGSLMTVVSKAVQQVRQCPSQELLDWFDKRQWKNPYRLVDWQPLAKNCIK